MACIFIVSVFLISGCAYLPKTIPGFGSDEQAGGAGMLTASIFSPANNGKVLSDYPLKPVVKIRNTGSYAAEGQACITGLSKEVFPGFSAGCACTSFQQEKDDSGKPLDLAFGSYQITKQEGQSEQQMVV